MKQEARAPPERVRFAQTVRCYCGGHRKDEETC